MGLALKARPTYIIELDGGKIAVCEPSEERGKFICKTYEKIRENTYIQLYENEIKAESVASIIRKLREVE